MNARHSFVIEIRDLEFTYQREANSPLLRIDRWDVEPGRQIFVHGPSGCGKTTLLNLLSGLLVPQRGDLLVLKQNLTCMRASQRDQFRAQHIGFVHQQFNLIPYLTVLDNLQLAKTFAKQSQSITETLKRINIMFERLQLSGNLLQRKASQISVGQQQRVAIARALINSPEIVIADEPTSALDSDAKMGFINLLRDVVAERASTLIFVSHDYSFSKQFDECIDLREFNTGAQQIAC